MIKKVALLPLALALFGALGVAACKQAADEEGRWVRLPGGQTVQTQAPVEYNDKRLIYKIDEHRYFTMMTHNGDCSGLGGTVRYHDTKRDIDGKIGSFSFRDEPIFAMDPGQYLAIPDPSATSLQNNARLYFSTDYGRSWKDIRFIDPQAGVIVKDDILVYLDGSASVNNPVEIRGGQAWGFAQLIAEEKSPEEATPIPNFFRYQEDKWVRISSKWDREVNRVNIDMAKLANVSPPSGWRHLRCDPIPTVPPKP